MKSQNRNASSRRNKRSRNRNNNNRVGSRDLNDRISVIGSDLLANIAPTNPAGLQNAPFSLVTAINGTTTYIPLKPARINDRVAYFGSLFSRYRYNSLRIEYRALITTTTPGGLALGLLDDADEQNYTGNITTPDQVNNLRVSNENAIWKNFSLMWTPVDPKKWYYTNTSAEPERFTVPVTLFGALNNTSAPSGFLYGNIRIHYDIQFEGAIPVVPSLVKAIAEVRAESEKHSNDEVLKRLTRFVVNGQ